MVVKMMLNLKMKHMTTVTMVMTMMKTAMMKTANIEIAMSRRGLLS